MHARNFTPPPLLPPGSRVALVAPAGPLRGEADVTAALANARSLDWEPIVGRHVSGRAGYHSGTDAERLADLGWALTAPQVDGVWCLRGGYGVMRLLERIPWREVAARPRAILGYSDITALLAGAAARAGVGGYHAPVARNPLTEFSLSSMRRALHERGESCGSFPSGTTLRPGRAAGPLVAANLALLAALCGTAFLPPLAGTVLVLEDVNEPAYRIDRMLRQLRLAGALDGVRALLFGEFVDCREQADEDGARSLNDLFAELAEELEVPCATGAPVGHMDDQWTLPWGVEVELDAVGMKLELLSAAG